jgi:FlaA1/EpsC-like NDP-sugar epimerase
MHFDVEKSQRSYWFKALIVLIDVSLVGLALCCAYLIRFDFYILPEYRVQLVRLLPILVLVRIAALYYRGGYRSLWRYTSLSDLVFLLQAVALGSVLLVVINYFRNYPLGIVIAVAFAVPVVVHRGAILLKRSMRYLVIGLVFAAVLILTGGVYVFTIVVPGPVSIAELPLGQFVTDLDFQNALAMPRTVVVLEAILSFLLIGAGRLTPRLLREVNRARDGRRVLLFGAGNEGENLVRAMVTHPEFGYHPVGFIDDHPDKQRISIHGVSVLGTRQDLDWVVEQYRVQELQVAISELPVGALREVAQICLNKGIPVRRIPGLSSLLYGQLGLSHLEDVDIENLLGRAEVELDQDRVVAYLENQVVLVTGAGGSIGAELCRQISRCRPKRLLLLGKGENSIYQIQQELASMFPEQDTICLIGDISNPGKIDHVFRTYVPGVVFHAAAHKHVPFMEDCPEEAVRNNVFGTQAVASAALQHGTSRFVLISSDKAVHPSSVMGATKKIAELILHQMSTRGATQFITVRFGNVLRSRGSVVPLFERQIREGGPVTVTHSEMTRYFMSIPEAVRLVLHSGAVGSSGDLCILDMGQPVRIVDLAKNMIRLVGREPHEEIDIVFTGIRPGEKLHEELFTDVEANDLRKVDKIMLGKPEGCDWERFDEQLERLSESVEECSREEISRLLRQIIPSYQSQSYAASRSEVGE